MVILLPSKQRKDNDERLRTAAKDDKWQNTSTIDNNNNKYNIDNSDVNKQSEEAQITKGERRLDKEDKDIEVIGDWSSNYSKFERWIKRKLIKENQ